MGVLGMCQSVTAEYIGDGTRIDYFNGKGERFSSSYAEPGGQLYFDVRNNPEEGFVVSNSYLMGEDTYIGAMKFIPWGVESYPVNIINESPGNIEVGYDILQEQKNQGMNHRVSSQDGSADVLCGSGLRFIIRVPEGTYPVFSINLEYTGLNWDGNRSWVEYRGLGLSELGKMWYVDQRLATDMQSRAVLAERLSGNGQFNRVEGESNVWTFDFTMPNESIAVRVSYERPDNELLRQSVLMALCELYVQHRGIDYNSNSGDPWVMNYFGEGLSQDYVSEFFHRSLPLQPMESFLSSQGVVVAIPWANAFTAIAHANVVLDNIDRYTDASQKERDLARAQMLVLRSHSYFRLLQIYGARWADSDNGNMFCAPMETSLNTENLPLSTMRDIADRCYADLDEAMEIFGRNDFKREHMIQPDMDVARGVKMRIAMLREDWQVSKDMAEKILIDKPLTTNEELQAGFFSDNPGWIWGAYNDMQISEDYTNYLYYYTAQCIYACNGIYAANWMVGGGGIDKDLYLSISEGDVRRSLFAMPDQLAEIKRIHYSEWATWYNSMMVDANTLLASMDGHMGTPSQLISSLYEDRKPAGVDFPAFSMGEVFNSVPVQFGAQVKFYSPTSYYGSAATLFMRSEEALLSLAEACCQLGDEAAAREWLTKLNAMRCEGYSCTVSGLDLLAEIRNTRKIELWGEGHSWFDQKRWNIPISKRVWIEGDETSGNWFTDSVAETPLDYANGWRCPVPAYYVRQNPLVDIKSLGYTGVTGYEMSSQLPALQKEGSGSCLRNVLVDMSVIGKPIKADIR